MQDTDHANNHIIFWKSGYTGVGVAMADIARQGSYLSDTIDLSATPTATRVLVRGEQGNDTITGHDGTDALFGDGGNDVINAGAGNDLVALSAGVDTLNGGDGTDILALWVKGQEAMPSFSADGKLQLLSALGTWSNNSFAPDANGYQLDWTFDFNGQTGSVLAQRAGSTETSTATGFEKIRIYKDSNKQVDGETTNTVDMLLGTGGNDTLTTTGTQGILNGLDGDDTINVVTADIPALMGGNGNDTVVLNALVFTRSSDGNGSSSSMLPLHGGAGTDTLKLGADVTGQDLFRPSSDAQATLRSLEVFDITGSTASTAAGNTLTMTAQWLRELTDTATTRSFKVMGDANDTVNLLTADNWQQQTTSDQSGYTLYQTTYASETLKLYVADAILTAGHVVMG